MAPHQYATRYQNLTQLPSTIQRGGPGVKAFCDAANRFSVSNCTNMLIELKICEYDPLCDKCELLREIRYSLQDKGLLKGINIDCLIMIIGSAIIHGYQAMEDIDGHVENALMAWGKMDKLARKS